MADIDDSFQVTDSGTDARTVDALNTSFKSIEEMIEDWIPYQTDQDFAVLSYSGYISQGTVYSGFTHPATTINVFGVVGTSYWFVGTLNTVGEFTASISQYVEINQPYRRGTT